MALFVGMWRGACGVAGGRVVEEVKVVRWFCASVV